jgi:hypothetical protein
VVAPSEPLHFALVVLRDAHGVEFCAGLSSEARQGGVRRHPATCRGS